ncbi:NIPSNAP family protein [Sphingobium amiense]|uniref:NIPSNAP family protein n=1 Tax=Sphingobium amiense TaxID=135719 RepID=A0A494W2G7_9SPHN|nr:NIPSNAP family protein [Sphingobium amiense]BBD98391.1 NIPSNAP family protein [Sphingobium amiense]
MIHEFRRYRIKPGMLASYLDAFERLALPSAKRHMRLLAFWTSDIGDLNHVFHLWEFEDHQHRADSYAAMRAEPQYRDEFVPLALPMVEAMHSSILTPTGFSAALPLIAGR